jgi:hypothetical protein
MTSHRPLWRKLFCLTLLVCLSQAAAADPFERNLFVTSGVASEQAEDYLERLDRLGAEAARLLAEVPPQKQAAVLHGFLHRRVLRGRYEPSASNLGVALDGGPYNCVAATLLLCLLGERCGLEVWAMSTPGHVWSRVNAAGRQIDIETTSRDWFMFVEKYQGLPTSQVSPAMARHRQRVANGRRLAPQQQLAVLHFNRGVTFIREQRMGPAAWANLQALALDPECLPARDNLAAVARRLSLGSARGDLYTALIRRQIQLALAGSLDPLIARQQRNRESSQEFAGRNSAL